MPSHARPDDLHKFFNSVETYYNPLHEKMKRMHKLYKQQYEGSIPLPENVSMHQSSLPTRIVDELRDQIRIDEPTVRARARGTSREAKRDMADQQLWGSSVILTAGRESTVNPWGQARHDLLLRGAGCVKHAIKEDALREPEDDEAKAQQPDLFPFLIKAVDPLMLYPSPGPGPLRYMIERQRRRVMDMWELYPQWTDPYVQSGKIKGDDANNPVRHVEWLEFWSWMWDPARSGWEGYYIVEVDRERIIDIPNPFGHVPYAFKYSGLGRMDEAGDPNDIGISVLELIEGELKQEVLLKTAMNAAWQFHVFPRLLVKGLSAKDAAAMFMKGPGGIIQLPESPAASAEWLAQPPPNEQMMQALGENKEMISSKVSPALGGQRTADYGIHQALQIGQALKVLGPVRSALNNIASDELEMLASLIVRFDLRMNVHGNIKEIEKTRMVSPDTFRHRSMEVDFEAVDPAENDRRMLALLSVDRAQNKISDETFMRIALKGVIDDPEEEAERIMSENLLKQMFELGHLLPVAMQAITQLQEEESVDAALAETSVRARTAASQTVGNREQNIEQVAGTPGSLTETRETAQAGQTAGGI